MAQIFDDGWAQRPAQASRWGHSGPRVFAGVLGTMALLAVLPVSYPPGGEQLVSLALIALIVVTLVEMRRHDRALCERCAADFPLNPAQEAETYRRRLATAHLLSERRAATWYLVVILFACLLPLFAPAPLRVPAQLLWLASLGSLVYLMQSGVTHRRLQPWCPHCGPQGGSDQVEAPEPTPLDSMS